MFLDDELLMLGRNCKLTDEDITECVGKMINVSFNNLSNRLNGNKDNASIIAGFKRVNKTWEIVAEKLDKEGRGFIKRNGFRLFVESNPKFKGVFF